MYPKTNPRSILKHNQPVPPRTPSPNSTATSRLGCAVRFPSSPKISTVYLTHCPASYDRRPIVVLPNSCALPDRGCREYEGTSSSPQTSPATTSPPQSWGNHVHPSIFGRMCAGSASSSDEDSDRRHSSEDFDAFGPPPLTHDDGSSEESDGIASPPPETCGTASPYHRKQYTAPSQLHLHCDPLSHPPIPNYDASQHLEQHQATEYSLSFLPHAPSSPHSPRKRSEKKHGAGDYKLKRASPPCSFADSWGAADDSCLGGF